MRLSSKVGSLHIFKNIKKQSFGIFRPISADKRGFLTVETAIFLPIFIIGVLTYAYLIKFMAIEENVFHSFADEARILSGESGKNPLSAPFFESTLKDRLYDENGNDLSTVEVDRFLYRYPIHGMSDMISMDLNYDVNVKLPIPFRKSLPISESLMIRGFVGKEEALDPFPFEEMEKEKKSDLVWIFPRSGGRYHGENCTYIKSEPKQLTMSDQIRHSYNSCSICDSKGLSNGSLVYVFRTGRSYHKGSCPTVDKYVISIEREEAIEEGYTACAKCGGN